MQCECFVRAAYVCAAQPLTLETIEEKLVKDQQQQLPPSAELSATQSPNEHRAAQEPCSTIGSHAPLFQYLPPPPLLESSDQLSGTPAPTPVMKVNGREGGGAQTTRRTVVGRDVPGRWV